MLIYNKLVLTYLINRAIDIEQLDYITVFSLRNYLKNEIKSDDLNTHVAIQKLLLSDNHVSITAQDFQDDMCEMIIYNYYYQILFYEYGRIRLKIQTYNKSVEFEYHINDIDSQKLKLIDPNDVAELQRKPQKISEILNMIHRNRDVIYLYYRMYIDLKHNFIYDKNNA